MRHPPLVAATLLLGCTAAVAAALPSASPALSPRAPAQLPPSLAEYRFVSSLVVTDRQSPLYGMHHIYANPKAWDVLVKEGLFPFPRGSLFIDLIHEPRVDGAITDEGGGRVALVMQKDASARETGGWRFAAYRPDGSLVEQDTRSACFECHTRAKGRDFVFSTIPDLERRDVDRNRPRKK